MKKLLKKLGVLAMSAVIVLSGTVTTRAAGTDFDEFLDSEWKELMEDDYITMHYTVKDYKAAGLKKPEVTFGDISYEEFEEDVAETQRSLDKLHEFDFDSLDEAQQHAYLVFEDYCEQVIGMEKYPDHQEMFRPMTGSFDNCKDIFENFKFYGTEDIDDYFTLLKDYPRYIDQMLEMTKQQAAKGYFMPDDSLDEVLDDIDEFVAAGEENEMIVVFNNNLDDLEWLDEDAKAEYEEQNKKIILEQIIPAYKKVGETLEGLRGSRSVDVAVADYPDGPAYYAEYLRFQSSSDDSMQEEFEFLTKCIKDVVDYYFQMLQDNPDFDEPATIENLETLDEVIEYLRAHLDGFPEGPNVDYELAYLDESVAEDAMAYYIEAPIDDINDNVIHVNGDSVSDINTLYYTLAHEGFPGHCYQMTWCQDAGNPKVLQALSVIGYTEGWANYVERIMLSRSGLDEVSAESIACEEMLSYMICAAVDIAANGLGYKQDELSAWMNDLGLRSDTISNYYDYATAYPGALVPYGYGMARFWDLRARTTAALGDKFDEEEFHTVILTYGPRSFELVEQDMAAYVESKGCTLPDTAVLFVDDHLQTTPQGGGGFNPLWIIIPAVIAAAAIVSILLIRRRKKTPPQPPVPPVPPQSPFQPMPPQPPYQTMPPQQQAPQQYIPTQPQQPGSPADMMWNQNPYANNVQSYNTGAAQPMPPQQYAAPQQPVPPQQYAAPQQQVPSPQQPMPPVNYPGEPFRDGNERNNSL